MSIDEMRDVVLEHVACPLCSGGRDRIVLTGGDRLHGRPGVFSIVKCDGCGLMRTNPRPTPGSIGYFYPPEYGPFEQTTLEARAARHSSRTAATRRPGLLRRFARLIVPPGPPPVPRLEPGRMLEIGCASGSFLHEMAQQGWHVQGVEPSPVAAANATRAGYEVFAGTIEECPPPDKQFDLIVGWMVLEHVHQPVEVLRKLREWTRPGGWIALSVPDAASPGFYIFRDRWFALQLPSHLHHFTAPTLRRTLKTAGWQVDRLFWNASATNFLKSARYLFADRGHAAGLRLIDSILAGERFPRTHGLAARVLALTRLSGRMTIWARNDG